MGLEHRTLGPIDAIGVDEIQYAKGHKYLTPLYQIDIGMTRLLWVCRERTIQSFQGKFAAPVTSVLRFFADRAAKKWPCGQWQSRMHCL